MNGFGGCSEITVAFRLICHLTRLKVGELAPTSSTVKWVLSGAAVLFNLSNFIDSVVHHVFCVAHLQ